MKHTSKRLQALVLVLAMCVSFLQIPSFAAEDVTHSDKYSVGTVAIGTDGSFSITEYCSNHSKGDVCNTVKGTIATKKDNTGKTVKDEDKSTKITDLKLKTENVGVSTDVVDNTVATCAKAGQFTYQVVVTVEGKPTAYTRGPVTTDAATGKHVAVTAEDKAKSYEALENDKNFKEVSNTATCKAKGVATFAKYCDGCGQFVETFTVESPIVYHQFFKDEKGQDKEFEEVIEAATCGKAGEAYHYKQCKDCGQKFYASNADGVFKETAIVYAKKFDIEKLPHTFEYKVVLNYGREYVTKADKADQNLFTVESKCTVCSDDKHTEEDHQAKVTKVELVADKTVEPKFDCVAGSKTYKVTYTATDYSKEKINDQYQPKEVTEEVTVPYYNKYSHYHDRTDVYVPDEESVVKATCTKDGHYNMVNPCKVCGDKEVVATVKIPATGKHTAAAAKKENVVAATTKKGGSYDLVVRCADCGEVLSSTHKTTAKITVKASKVTKVTNVKGKKAKVTVKKASSISGYQIQYGTKKSFSGAKSVKTTATTKTLTKLTKNKKYYVRVRTYKVVDGKTYYSSWSGSKTVTIKK